MSFQLNRGKKMSDLFSPRNFFSNNKNNNNNNQNDDEHQSPSSSPTSNNSNKTTNELFNRFQSDAKSAFDRIQSEASEFGDKVSAKLGPELDALKRMMLDQADAFKKEKLRMLEDFQNEKKKLVVSHLSKKLASAINALMNIIVIKIKDGIEDPYMPRWVKRMIDTLIDAIWPDVAEDIKEELFAFAHPRKPVDHGEPPCCFQQCPATCCFVCDNCCCAPFPKSVPVQRSGLEEHHCCTMCCCGLCYPACFFEFKDCTFFYGFLAWIRYTTCPYDRGFWRQIRDPAWWFLTLVSAIPKFGISQIYYLLWFLCFDKSDEFQLLNFIKSFKCLQFVSLGVLSATIGGAQLFICSLPEPWICPAYAPREELFTLFLFISQIFLVWFAFCFLSSAKNKGGLYHQISKAKEAKLREEARDAKETLLTAMAQETVEEAFFESRIEDTEGRNRLYFLLIYDTIVFLLCIGLAVFSAFFNLLDPKANVQNFDASDSFWESKNWKFVMTLYWIKCFYGLSSFPFLLLQIPGISALFSHARPTAYNPFGQTVPAVGHEPEDDEEDSSLSWRTKASGGAGGGRKNSVDDSTKLMISIGQSQIQQQQQQHPLKVQQMGQEQQTTTATATATTIQVVPFIPTSPPPSLQQNQRPVGVGGGFVSAQQPQW